MAADYEPPRRTVLGLSLSSDMAEDFERATVLARELAALPPRRRRFVIATAAALSGLGSLAPVLTRGSKG